MSLRAIPAAVVDRAPRNEVELWDKREWMDRQTRELGPVVLRTQVTCPCGTSVALANALQCFHCGLYFCRLCAGRHFEEDRP